MMNKNFHLILISGLLISACLQKFSIPEDLENESELEFSAGDTTYLQLSPVWGDDYGIGDPTEISIAQDGRIFIADSAAHSILVLDQDGGQPDGFFALRNLEDRNGMAISPIDMDVDQKMNVFFIDGSQRVFIWNQYWNTAGIAQVSSTGSFRHIQTGALQDETAGTESWLSLLNNDEWELMNTTFTSDQSVIDSLINPYLFYDGSMEKNQYLDPYYKPDSSQFTGITSPAGQGNMIFVSDSYGGTNNQFRLVQVNFQRSRLLELQTGELVWAFTGVFGATIKGYGTGAGTVNEPLSIEVDYQGNLYYTQAGDFFPVHMIIPNLSGDFAVYSSGFQPGASDIMNASLYGSALDVAVDENKNVYVVDGADSDVIVFDANGKYFKEAGYESNSNIEESIMNQPAAVTVDKRGVVYVCDRGDGAVYRFKLSNSLDEDLKPDD